MAMLVLALGLTFDCAAQMVVPPTLGVTIEEKHNHTPSPRYAEQGWDTAASALNPELILTAKPYLPVQYFNGTYSVEQIPYAPADTSFWMEGQGTLLEVGNDIFSPAPVSLDSLNFPFYFFGVPKHQFRVGENGVLTFTDNFGHVSFNPNFCPWSFSHELPWTTTEETPYGEGCFDRMHDAIYGVLTDLFRGTNGENMTGQNAIDHPHCGIYYGVLGEYPNRKIIASWNKVPVFARSDVRETFQVVCYESTNIIEVHIKKHHGGSDGATNNGGRSIIGIQNATGLPQEQGAAATPTAHVANGSPAAFFPEGYNNTAVTIDSMAFRFTPQGLRAGSCKWYRLFDDGRTPVELASNPDTPDTNGHYSLLPAEQDTQLVPSRAVVSPTRTSRYMLELSYTDASGINHLLHDTITVGFDTTLRDTTHHNPERIDGAEGASARIYQRDAQLVVEGANGQTVTLYDALGRPLAVRRNEADPVRFTLPAAGAYLLKIGNAPARRIVVAR